ncbi:MAG: NAD(+)/NADH kinase [Candidatus Margulisbacteria bacterium]|nr:NAD(+)/NADH kinase [Candidatus Margulisiibacteriota bacterium]MBU1022450.1 NAD(+)/NADH kinase [Candidatus Margulisiibacteriota bacterium]MBU1728434.1 NAD(+)/NADH kinase [Candidatus Margulisiibacteriota bacterium]MBU1954581.1 NAD(+)/NADH kinase [Candidatus Margulisiibacteriota bacterium]
MAKISLFYKKEDKTISAAAKKLIGEIKKAFGIPVEVETISSKDNIVISVGGDGTLLRSAKIAASQDLPILGIHLGGLGFLNEVELKERIPAIKKALDGKFKVDSRMMIEGHVIRKGKTIGKVVALNDIVIGKSDIARTVTLDVNYKKHRINTYRSDGLIVSTPTGSTAHNLSAGGPLLTPDTTNIVITPICPIKTGHKPIVLETEEVEIIIKKTPGKKQAILTADGQQKIYIETEDKIVIEKSKLTAKFMRLKPYDFFAICREKMWWG